ncbi:deoxyribonuclease V [Embleya sp. NPDC005575]|uniref:deoxyribonuclease V n=1 Tax=Embleya sp. NPDC005575 TaxID=3156892 RepID=UPI0033B30420
MSTPSATEPIDAANAPDATDATGPWPRTAAEALAVQDRLRPSVDTVGPGPGPADVRFVAGLDVAYAEDSDELAAAVVVLDARTHAVVERSVAHGVATFPYVPGLFAFREVPALLAALEQLDTAPDLLVCDGQGLAHPRRFGLACHLGVLTGLPAVGVGKTPFVGAYETPGEKRGDAADLVYEGDVVGRALRTRDAIKPVFVSIGHGVDLDTACAHVLALTPRYRLPETTRQADQTCRQALKTHRETTRP